jgi:RNA polymerase sigma factor (sigma-70 family)
LAGSSDAGASLDRQLVERFARNGDEPAFALLMERHGPMVWNVCRSVLHHQQDAEDAFQATFLILVRKAATIRRPESVGSWLYGVAYHAAVRAKADADRRRRHEPRAAAMPGDDPLLDMTWREIRLVLHQELERLPEKYRAPLVLCYLEGKTQDEAARQLGWTPGTVRGRVDRGREQLRARLARRGVALSVGLLATVLTQKSTAALPAALVRSTIGAARLAAAGGAAAGMVSAEVAALVHGVTRAMFLSKIKIATMFLLIVGVCGTGVGVATDQPTTVKGAEPQSPAGQNPSKPAPADDADADLYLDVTQQSGIDFIYRNGQEAGHYAILESLGGGVALIDYDGDGLLDIFITGGGYFDGPDKKQIRGHANRLYRNLGGFKFRDVTQEVGLDLPRFYSHGCAVIDYDCDGWPDLLVTGWGRVVLYHNEPVDPKDPRKGRHFVDVTRKAGLMGAVRWATSAAWADFDGDGYPDLYICQYVNWSMENNPRCGGYTADVPRDICPPKQFTGLPHKLFRNNGDGTFTDVSKEAKLRPFTGHANLDSEPGKGLGVVAVDINDDGKPDIFVANDTEDKFLYLNKSTPGTILFAEVAIGYGVARDFAGVPNGSKGVAAADYDETGRPSLWCTNYENEVHGLYRNGGEHLFVFTSHAAGISTIGQLYVGFGTDFLDVDNDGSLDLVIANGHFIRHPKGASLRQRAVLFRNKGIGRFEDISDQGGVYFRSEHLGRGLAVGDLDNDGRADLIISHLNEPVAVLRNQVRGPHWLGIELVGKKHRDVVGAKVIVEVAGRKLTRFVQGGGSYLSSGDRRLLFGLGKADKIDRLTVVWKPGQEQQWSGEQLPLDRYLRLIEGEDEPRIPRAGKRP